MSRKKTSRSSPARRGTVRYGWRKRRAMAIAYAVEAQRRLTEMVT